ncbi:MAG: hypothetical protein ACI9KE_002091 [Polyangiales bacterium]|jgi:hypothetical protein
MPDFMAVRPHYVEINVAVLVPVEKKLEGTVRDAVATNAVLIEIADVPAAAAVVGIAIEVYAIPLTHVRASLRALGAIEGTAVSLRGDVRNRDASGEDKAYERKLAVHSCDASISHDLCSARFGFLLSWTLALSACAPCPELTQIFGVEWEEMPLRRRDGSIVETVYQLESDEFRAVRTCGTRRVELSTPVTHVYTFKVLEGMTRTTSADGLSCRSTFRMDSIIGFVLDPDGENLYARTVQGGMDVIFPLEPYTAVNGIFGGRRFTELDDEEGEDVINWFFTPQFLLSKAECSNGISSTVVIPIEIGHNFIVEGTVRSRDGDCELEFLDGVYRYYPEVAGELLLERVNGSRILLTPVSDTQE